MAEQQNCSESKVNPSDAKRRASLSTLSKILKSQTSSFQRRVSSNCKLKQSTPCGGAKSGGGFKMFLIKAVVGAGAVYLSAMLGVWGEAEDSKAVLTRIKSALRKVEHQSISDNFKHDIADKFNQSTDFLKNHLETIPKDVKACYDKSEKYIANLIKGK